MKYALLSLLVAVMGFLPHLAHADVPKPEHVKVNLYASVSEIAPGQPFTLIIEQIIDPEWHTYWKNPGDSGTSTTVKWDLPDGGAAGELQFPTPSRIPYGPLLNFGYAGRALFQATITPPAALNTETYTVNAKLEWLVCKDICVPEGDTYSVMIPVGGPNATANTSINDLIHDVTISQPIAVDWPATFHEDNNNFVLTFTPAGQAADLIKAGAKVEYFPEEWGLFQNPAEQVVVGTDDESQDVMLVIPRDTRDLAEVKVLNGTLAVTDTSGTRLGFVIKATPLPTAAPATAGTPVTKPATSSTTLPAALVLALLGGIILNLMPCVFPVLSLKVISISRMSGAEKAHMRVHGIAYGAGVILTFLLIAAILFALQMAGAAIGWGFQLQQPVVVAGLIYLLVLIGLSLLGWREFDLNRLIPDRFHGNHDGVVGSFATGMLATIVATPCTAPFMGAAMGFALTQNPVIGLLVFAMLGLGLALPFILICFIPVLQRALPRPGVWMVYLKQFFAFPMFMAAIWLIWVLAQQTGADGVGAALLGVLAIIFLLWLWPHKPATSVGRMLHLFTVLMSLVLITGLTVAQNSFTPAEMTTTNGAKPFSKSALDAAIDGDNPVLVNMTAAWCITCKINERVALSTEATKRVLDAHQVTYLKGDWTNYNAEITTYLAGFGRNGVPLYVFYGPRDSTTGKRPEPAILPQLLTEAIIRETISPH